LSRLSREQLFISGADNKYGMSQSDVVESRGSYFKITHGSLSISVPYSIFKGNTAVLDPKGVEEFRALLASRYPWLSRYALDIIVENARTGREQKLLETQSVAQRARNLLEKGSIERSLALLDKHIEECPEDAEALYVRGEALCRVGRLEEGYRCISKARLLSRS
jgi:tetratricopeptide (TPR) repeat protein